MGVSSVGFLNMVKVFHKCFSPSIFIFNFFFNETSNLLKGYQTPYDKATTKYPQLKFLED